MSPFDSHLIEAPPLHAVTAAEGIKETIDGLLTRVVALGGSDLHLTVGQAPCPRIHGSLAPLSDWPALTPSDDTERMARAVINEEQWKIVRAAAGVGHGLRASRRQPIPVEPLPPAWIGRRGVPVDSAPDTGVGGPGPAGRGRELRPAEPGPGPDHRSDGIGQDDHPGQPARRGQPDPGRSHHDDRGPDRVRARPSTLPGEPARGRFGYRRLRRRPQTRPAPGPGHHPGRGVA